MNNIFSAGPNRLLTEHLSVGDKLVRVLNRGDLRIPTSVVEYEVVKIMTTRLVIRKSGLHENSRGASDLRIVVRNNKHGQAGEVSAIQEGMSDHFYDRVYLYTQDDEELGKIVEEAVANVEKVNIQNAVKSAAANLTRASAEKALIALQKFLETAPEED